MDGLTNITDVIRAKERELQKIQDMRFTQLEKTIEDRDMLLLESSKRFEQLKDDFQYNLRLLEARDREITRLEGIIEKQGREKEDLEQQVRNLLSRIESMQEKEKERMDKFEQDKALSKRIMSETKAVIESMQWSAEEDLRMKNNEIASLKREIQAVNRAKDDAIEVQRKDLTTAFEQIIQQREEQIAQREGELAHQVSQLDQRFERLSTENMSLKATLRDLKINHERDVEEVSRLEEANRQLTYQLEDTQRSKEQVEDSLKRQVVALQAEHHRSQDQRTREKQESEGAIEKFKNEAIRERDFRAVLEKRLEDIQDHAATESYNLHEEVAQQQRRIHSLEQELDEVKSEKEQTLVKLGTKRVEAETLMAKNRMLSDELESANDRNRRIESNYQALEGTLTQLQKEFDHYKVLMDRELSLARETAKDELTDVKRSSNEQMTRMRHNHEEEIQKIRTLYEEKLHDKQQEVEEVRALHGDPSLLHLHSQQEKDAEITHLKIQVQVKENALQEERMEADALKLRLKALESQLLASTQELRQWKNDRGGSGSGGGATAGLQRPTVSTSIQLPSQGMTPGGPPTDMSLPEIPTFDMPSPMMSEDFNLSQLQYPESPVFPASKYTRGGRQSSGYGAAMGYAAGIASNGDDDLTGPRYGFSPVPRATATTMPPPPPPPPPASALAPAPHLLHEEKHALDTITAENEMLKKVVKEMRQDIENLRTVQEHFQSPPRVKETTATTATTAADVPLAAAAQPATTTAATTTTTPTPTSTAGAPVVSEAEHEMREEIERLKRERKKLMDTGNELRSALLKAQVKDSEDTHEYLEHLRDENVGTVYQWIRGRPEASSASASASASASGRGRSRSRSVGRDDYFSHLRDPPAPRQERFFQMDEAARWDEEEDAEPTDSRYYEETAVVEDLSMMEDAHGTAPSSYAAARDIRRPPSSSSSHTAASAAPRRMPVDAHKPQTAIRRRLEDPMAVVGNAVPASRTAPRSGIYPATRTLSAGPTRPESAGQGTRSATTNAAFVVHKVPPGGYVTSNDRSTATTAAATTTAALGRPAPSRGATRSTPGQEQALERLRRKQSTAEERIEEEIRLAKSKVVNYAALKSRDEHV